MGEITKAEEWFCLLCDPTPIKSLKATYMKIYKSQEEIKEKRKLDRKKGNLKAKYNMPKKPAPVKSPRNFLEENISEAFKTLEVYQKALETERARVKKTIEEGMSPDTAVSITRKLRKLYAVTQKNMDLLDRAIVESFVENFPTESTRIHMGRVAPAQPQYAPPVKRGAAKNKKKIKQKIKVKPKGKGNAESDVECIDVSEDDEYYNPKKRSRPGPASSKKANLGLPLRKGLVITKSKIS